MGGGECAPSGCYRYLWMRVKFCCARYVCTICVPSACVFDARGGLYFSMVSPFSGLEELLGRCSWNRFWPPVSVPIYLDCGLFLVLRLFSVQFGNSRQPVLETPSVQFLKRAV